MTAWDETGINSSSLAIRNRKRRMEAVYSEVDEDWIDPPAKTKAKAVKPHVGILDVDKVLQPLLTKATKLATDLSTTKALMSQEDADDIYDIYRSVVQAQDLVKEIDKLRLCIKEHTSQISKETDF